MGDFFQSLLVFEIIMFILASVSTILLVVQIVLLLIGFSSGTDIDGFDSDAEIGSVVSFITVKGLIAFFAIGGWVGFGLSRADTHISIVIIVAFFSGAIALVAIGLLYRLCYKLQSNGNLLLSNAIGLTGKVYLTIPPKGKGTGKVNIMLQERYIEADAITNTEESIKTDDLIKVIGYINDILIVEKI